MVTMSQKLRNRGGTKAAAENPTQRTGWLTTLMTSSEPTMLLMCFLKSGASVTSVRARACVCVLFLVKKYARALHDSEMNDLSVIELGCPLVSVCLNGKTPYT